MRRTFRHAITVSVVVIGLFVRMDPASAALFVGSGGADNIFGTNAADTMNGASGSDKVFGKRGNDRLSESGLLLPGGGKDVAVGGPDGATVIDDDASRDRIVGNEGADVIFAWNGVKDVIQCGAARDAVYADPFDVIGTDCEGVINGSIVISGETFTFGSNRADTITGTAGTDAIAGRGGNDTILGGAFGDQIHAGPGRDAIDGEGGGDFLIDDDSTGGDTLKGGVGADTIFTADGAIDTYDCGGIDGDLDKVYADANDIQLNCEGTDEIHTVS